MWGARRCGDEVQLADVARARPHPGPTPLMPLQIFAGRNRSGAYTIMLALGASLLTVF